MPLPRFVFLVHALSRLHRCALGIRAARPGLAFGLRDGTSPDDLTTVCSLRLDGVAEGVVVGIPILPEPFLADADRAVDRMVRAVELAGPIDAVGLGSLCAVVAGRGEALGKRLSVPVTTGAAATAWALAANARRLAERRGGPIAVIGSAGAVGQAVAASLAATGFEVRADHPRGATGGAKATTSPEEAADGCPVVVGAGTTGGVLAPASLHPCAVVIDVALGGTLRRPVPVRVPVLAGEAVALPAGWRRGGWGLLYHVLAGYGPFQAFACLVEPLVLAATGRTTPFSMGRRVDPSAVAAFGDAAERLGFRPRLAYGWAEVDPGSRLLRGPTRRGAVGTG